MKNLKISLCAATLCMSAQVQAGNILITDFFGGGSPSYGHMTTSLAATGHTVTVFDSTTGGALATELSTNSYDQVFLFDLTSSLFLNAADNTALSNFWGVHSGLVVDTRSYGYHFQGDNSSEVALLQNVAQNLDLSGGGIWVGTDHAPNWTRNANPFLAEIGIEQITGLFSDPVNFADPTSVLLSGVTPSELWGGGQSVGQAPIGIQPNGTDMFIHFGHTRADGSILPYISASFDLQGVVPQPPTVPEPHSILLLGIGLLGWTLSKRKTI